MRRLALVLFGIASAHAADLLIAAASDLAPLTENLSRAFERSAHTPVKFTLASSGSLAKQIENGAPFDVYLSADERLVKDRPPQDISNRPPPSTLSAASRSGRKTAA